jgi:alcohol oxidase
MAKKLVIISAGTCGTPQILERSGIGNPAVLRAAGIPVSVPLPTVGEYLQDHDSLYPVYTTTPNISTFTSFVGGRTDRSVAEIDFVRSGSGMFSSNFADVAGKVSPRTNWDYNKIGARNAEFFRSNPDKPAFMLVMVNTFLFDPRIAEPRPKNDENVITMRLWTCYPRSKGSIHITSPNPQSTPMFNPGRLEDEDDVKMLAWAYKTADRLAMKMSCLIARVPGYHPRPGEKVEDYVRRRTGTAWHMVGTARMGSSPHGGAVVDAMLNVYGVQDLMVADLSICPSTVGANTCSVALMIGEKAAELAAKKLQVRLDLES